MSTSKGVIRNGVLYALNASGNELKKLAYVEDVEFQDAKNVTDIKTNTGTVLLTLTNQQSSINGSVYAPGDAEILELLYRGAVTRVVVDGLTPLAGRECVVKFENANDAILLPIANANKTAVTVNTITLVSNPATSYDVTDDYTVSADPQTGLTLIKHVSTGAIPVGAEVTINYDVTPAASQILEPIPGGSLIPNTYAIVETDPDATTKQRILVVPACVIQTDMNLSFLNLNEENASPAPMAFTLQQQKRDITTNHINWALVDAINPS